MRAVLLIIGLILAVLLVIFGVQNTQLVNVQFLSLNTGLISLSLVIVVSAVVGAALVGIGALTGSVRRRFHDRSVARSHTELEQRNAELTQRVSTLERENAELRAVAPMTPSSSVASSTVASSAPRS